MLRPVAFTYVLYFSLLIDWHKILLGGKIL